MKFLKDKSGFTLIELTIAIAIVGTLLAIMLKITSKDETNVAYTNRIDSDMQSLETVSETYYILNKQYP